MNDESVPDAAAAASGTAGPGDAGGTAGPEEPQPRRGLSRRGLFAGAAGGLAVGGLAGAAVATGVRARSDAVATPDEHDLVDLTGSHPFYTGDHQAGIVTPPQRYAVFMTFELLAGASARDLQVLLARWSAAIAELTAGRPIGPVVPKRPDAVGQDTGEAAGLDPASLTVTVGLGPGLFDHRFGLEAKRPALLTELPALPSDNFAPGLTGGDLSVEARADDPQVAYHAVRNLARMVRSTAATGWTVMGFGRASAGTGQHTPRNLFGFKDGTRNVTTPDEFDAHVWLHDADWMSGGTYQVVRKIEMNIEIWDADRVSDQQRIFGRTKDEGGPLSGGTEFTTPDFTKQLDGGPAIDPASHVALAAPENNGGVKILRRGYNYTDGLNPYGQLDAGLLFVCYQNDPAHFVALQRRLGASDLLNEYVSHVGSGVFAIPPAPTEGHYLAEALFG